jgi:hypothetical protein
MSPFGLWPLVRLFPEHIFGIISYILDEILSVRRTIVSHAGHARDLNRPNQAIPRHA